MTAINNPDPLTPWQAELEQLEQMVRQGRPDAVRRHLAEKQNEPYGTEERIDAMARAMDVACQKGPEHLIEVAFERMLRTCLWCQIRLECSIEPIISSWGPGTTDAVRQLQAETVPNIERLQRHICQIAKAYSSVRHLLNLSGRPDDEGFKAKILKLVQDTEETAKELTDRTPEANIG